MNRYEVNMWAPENPLVTWLARGVPVLKCAEGEF